MSLRVCPARVACEQPRIASSTSGVGRAVLPPAVRVAVWRGARTGVAWVRGVRVRMGKMGRRVESFIVGRVGSGWVGLGLG